MLSDYINAYVEAIKANDEKSKVRIEKDLAKLGMDRYTLSMLAKEQMKGGLN